MFRLLFSPQSIALRQLQDRVNELTQTIQDKDEFLKAWNHDMGGPINGMKAALALLKKAEDGEDLKYVLDVCCIACQLLTDIYSNTGEYLNGRVNGVHLENIDLGEWLTDIVNLYQALAKAKDIEIGLTINPDLPTPIISDRVKLARIVSNLLNNAIKFTPRGKGIFVRAYNQQHHLFIEVHDKGIGIPNEQLSYIFMPYVKLDGKAPGLGIGLTICKKLIEQLNGKIMVASALASGSIFTIVLPLATPTSDSLNIQVEQTIDE